MAAASSQTAPIALISGKDVLGAVGGHETYVRAHARAAQRLGLEPHIYCVGPRRRQTVTDYGVVHHVIAPGPVAAQGLPLALAAAKLATPGRVLGIHGFALWASAGVIAGRLARHRGARTAVLCNAYATRKYEVAAMKDGIAEHHGRANRLRYAAWLAWINQVDDRLERWGYANCDPVLVNYESTARILRESYGDDLQIRRVPYATEAAFEPAPARAAAGEPPMILCVSRQDPRKGVDVLLAALGRLAGEGLDFHARLVGPGRLLESHRRLRDQLGLAGRVELPGRVEEVQNEYFGADIYVLPSLAEASGSVAVLEALRAGCAVVATRIDGLPEDLTDGEDSLLVDPADAVSLMDALRRLLTDPQLRERLAAGALQTHAQRFSAEAFAAGLAEVYSELGVIAGDPQVTALAQRPSFQ